MTTLQVIGRVIQIMRERKGLSQAEFAALIHADAMTVQQLELGLIAIERPLQFTVICEALDKEPSEMLRIMGLAYEEFGDGDDEPTFS